MIIEKNILLKDFTTFRTGGPADFFCRVQNERDLFEIKEFLRQTPMPFFVLGGGSNLLVSDEGFKGVVIKNEMAGISFGKDPSFDFVTAGAGENWDAFVGQVMKDGFYGLENLSLIPGTVGASVVQNIGAYGVEVSEFIEKVHTYNILTGEKSELTKEQCFFGYRDSFFKRFENRKFIVTSVTFKFPRAYKINISYKDLTEYFKDVFLENITPQQVREAVIDIRKRKLPDISKIGTAGSYFKNPVITVEVFDDLLERYPGIPSFPVSHGYVKVPLAWILDKVCGLKNVQRGNAGTYVTQPLALVNMNGGMAKDVIKLEKHIRDEVKNRTGIEIEREVEYVGIES